MDLISMHSRFQIIAFVLKNGVEKEYKKRSPIKFLFMRIWGCEILIWIIHMDYNFENLHDINTRKTINLFVFFSFIPLTAQWLNDDLVNKSRYVYLCLNATICCVRKYGPIEHFFFVCLFVTVFFVVVILFCLFFCVYANRMWLWKLLDLKSKCYRIG